MTPSSPLLVVSAHLNFSKVSYPHTPSRAKPKQKMFPRNQQHSQRLLPINKLIAGNVYISTGGKSYKSCTFLMKLLQTVQEECSRIRQGHHLRHCYHHHAPKLELEQERSTIVLAHAFADPCYNRSSFHLAGTGEAVAEVSSLIARLALQHDSEEDYRKTNRNYGNTNTTAHPYVGFVDHIAFMPLLLPQNNEAVSLFLQNQALLLDNHNNNNHTTSISVDPHQQHHSCSQAAKYVGEYLSSVMGCVVHYYGSASVDHAPLSKVRRDRTTFFQSGSLASSQPLPLLTTSCSSTVPSTNSADGRSDNNNEICVGSPFNFVENFNVRLSAKEANTGSAATTTTTVAAVAKRGAMSLCRTLRERDGGLEGVEALTLPYDDSTSSTASNSSNSSTSGSSTWEVACNLLSPYNEMGRSRKEDIRQKTMEWLLQYNTNNPNNTIQIEDMYSVGTTQEQCLHCLLLVLMEDMEEQTAAIYTHDETVSNQFRTYFYKK